MGRVKQFSAALVAAVLALAAAVVGILALTIWKPAQEVVASVTPTEPYVMTHAKMLPLIAKDVTVTVSAPDDQEVSLVLGTTGDVSGWIGDSAYDEVVGVESGMTTLKTVDHTADSSGEPATATPQSGESQSGASQSATAQPSASESENPESGESQSGASDSTSQTSDLIPTGNDMWLSEVTGTGSATLTLTDVPDGRSILATTDGSSAAPTLTLTWAVHRANVGATVAFSLCVLFAVMALVLFVLRLRVMRHRSRRARHLAERETADVTETQQIPVVGELDHDGMSTEPDVEDTDTDTDADAGTDEGPRTDDRVEDLESASDELAFDGTASDETTTSTGRHGRPGASLDVDPPETVPTDSGLIDVSGIREGMAFPSRRALREARARGENHVVIDGHEFDTGLIPTVSRASQDVGDGPNTTSEASESDGSEEVTSQGETTGAEAGVLDSRTIERGSWSSLMSGWIRGGKSKGGDDAAQS